MIPISNYPHLQLSPFPIVSISNFTRIIHLGDDSLQEWFVWGWFFTSMICLRMVLDKNDSFEDDSSRDWFVWGWFWTRMIYLEMILYKDDSFVDNSSQGRLKCLLHHKEGLYVDDSLQGWFIYGQVFTKIFHSWNIFHKGGLVVWYSVALPLAH